MLLRILTRILVHAAVLCSAPPLLRLLYGVEKAGNGLFLPRVDLRWVDESTWWSYAAAYAVAAGVLTWLGWRTPAEWGGQRMAELRARGAAAELLDRGAPMSWSGADAHREPAAQHSENP